jgi:hypothetical protein
MAGSLRGDYLHHIYFRFYYVFVIIAPKQLLLNQYMIYEDVDYSFCFIDMNAFLLVWICTSAMLIADISLSIT